MQTESVSYVVQFSNMDIATTLNALENSVYGIDRDLATIAMLTYILKTADPKMNNDDKRLFNGIESVLQHIGWIITLPDKQDPKDMN